MIDTKFNNSWDEILEKEFQNPKMVKLLNWLDGEYENKKIFPAKDNVFNAFKLTSYDEVKVILLAQDPYHATDKNGNRHAHGLAFSSQSIYEVPKSLQNIYKELHDDINFIIPKHSDLTKWTEQGVFLLNTVLSVEAGKANSHKGIGWEEFTGRVIEKLGSNEKPMVFLLWGAQSQKNSKYITGKNKLILETAHPSPLSSYRGFFGCKHFSQVNSFLISHGLEQINWQI